MQCDVGTAKIQRVAKKQDAALQSLGLQSSLSCPLAWDCAKAEFHSSDYKSFCFLSEGKSCMYVPGSKIPTVGEQALCRVFSMSFLATPMVASSKGDTTR